jgi:Amt family ammonium transporter
MSIEWVKYGKPSALGAVTGMVAGLGTSTPASGFVGPAGGLLMGVCAGFVCFYATMLLQDTLKIDDSLDVFPVHGVGGALGTIMAGVLVSNELGVFSGMGLAEGMTIGSQLMVQITGVVAVGVYTAIVTYVLLKIIDRITGLRVTAEEETSGLDVEYHNERGYDL